jgi:hypothetical protein
VPVAYCAALALLLLVANSVARATGRTPLWRPDRRTVAVLAAGAIAVMLVLPVTHSYYAGERFATIGGDLSLRTRHWRQTLDMMNDSIDDSAQNALFGVGLGRFPAAWYRHNAPFEAPGRVSYREVAGNRYLELQPPLYRNGYGDLLRVLQRVRLQPQQAYVLELDSQRPTALSFLHIRLCRRQLLYPDSCISLALPPPAGTAPAWQHHALAFTSAQLGAGNWLQRAPVQLELAAEGGVAPVAVDNLSLRGPDGVDLLLNGAFDDAWDNWFFSSDRHHLPWHIKNLALQLYFELGWFGALAMLTLVTAIGAPLLVRIWRGDPAPSLLLAAIAGFLVVGLFDSLVDVPRIGLLFFLLLWNAAGYAPVRLQPRPSTSRPVIPASSHMGKK